MSLGPELLVRQQGNPTDILREDIEDALKEYSELDLLVELLQNALDALDYRRYVKICEAASRDPAAVETIEKWNSAVVRAIEADYESYRKCSSAADKATLFKAWSDEKARRDGWWTLLSANFGASAIALADAADEFRARLFVTVRSASPAWIEVEDNGLGMADIPNCFRHKSSAKRPRASAPRRYGTRGSHGWGLTAILGMSDSVEVISRTLNSTAQAYRFSDYASFAAGSVQQPQNYRIGIDTPEASVFSERLRSSAGETGTHVRVRLRDIDGRTQLGYTLESYSPELFSHLLRLYTPVGQVNDYVLHPAFHCLRSSDLSVTLRSVASDGNDELRTVKFDFLRLSELPGINQVRFDNYVNTGWPSNVSVHTVHREKKGSHVYLSAAEVQGAELVTKAEANLDRKQQLPAYYDSSDARIATVPRGFQLALSGGMRSEYLARPPVGNMAMLRGIVLAETARPTLGRKYVMDQREAIPKAARDHQNAYEDVRLKVRPQAIPPSATPAQARWRREFFDGLIENHSESPPPPSAHLRTWATSASQEARTMLAFGELLALGYFGDLRLLRVHLQDRYDFGYLLRADLGKDEVPSPTTGAHLTLAGYAITDSDNRYCMYGIGEFKASGDKIFDDFDPRVPRKSPDTLDLLVCWVFDESHVDAREWSVEEATILNSEVPGQTHRWIPGGEVFKRGRPLPVISLATVIERAVASGKLSGSPEPWPDSLPKNYL